MQYAINGLRLDYRSRYQGDNALRASSTALAMETFALDFEPWYRQDFRVVPPEKF